MTIDPFAAMVDVEAAIQSDTNKLEDGGLVEGVVWMRVEGVRNQVQGSRIYRVRGGRTVDGGRECLRTLVGAFDSFFSSRVASSDQSAGSVAALVDNLTASMG